MRETQQGRSGVARVRNAVHNWYTDHTGAHELRWYSVGTATELVKDGAIESRDPPVR